MQAYYQLYEGSPIWFEAQIPWKFHQQATTLSPPPNWKELVLQAESSRYQIWGEMELKVLLPLPAAIHMFNPEANVIIYDKIGSDDEDGSPDLSAMVGNYSPEHDDMTDTD